MRNFWKFSLLLPGAVHATSRKAITTFLLLTLLGISAPSGYAQRQMEKLGRGLVVLRASSSQAYLGWRLFATDPPDIGFNVYRSANGAAATKINSSLITKTTDFADTSANFSLSNAWFVVAVTNGIEFAPSPASGLPANAPMRQYIPIALQPVTGGLYPPYDVKFCWVGDFDGDGEFDYLVDRLSIQGQYNQYLQAYKRDGTLLWQIDMGYNSTNQYNIEPGASAISVGDKDNVTVYDFDGDGRAEVAVRTARGVVLPNGSTIVAANDVTQFISILDGLTGAELARTQVTNMWTADGPMNAQFGVLYCDGIRPSLLFHGENRQGYGAFQRQVSAYDFRDGQLTHRWTFRPGGESGLAWGHQIRIMDINRDGIDDVVEIGSALDGATGRPLFDTGLMHGDRFHLSDLDPNRPGLEMFSIQQNNPTLLATALIDMSEGTFIKTWYAGGFVDVGRGCALDMTPAHRGYEMYSTQPGIFDCKGNQIYANNVWPPEAIWWDADLLREFEDGAGSGALAPAINKFNPATGGTQRIYTLYNEDGGSHQAYGGRAAVWGDLFGDWREEFMVVADDYNSVRIYTTKIPATNRIYCLAQNPSYRCQMTCRGYYQASYMDYYLGHDMPEPPPPPVSDARLVWRGVGSSLWDSGTANWFTNNLWISNNIAVMWSPGDTVLFDSTGSNNSPVILSGSIEPGWVQVRSPKDYIFDSSSGLLSGKMKLTKAGGGGLTLIGTNDYTGPTLIAEGLFLVNGALPNSALTIRGGVYLDGRVGGTGVVSSVSVFEGGGVSPGQGTNSPGTLTVGHFSFNGRTLSDFDLSDPGVGMSDLVVVNGDLTLKGANTLKIRMLGASAVPGVYPLIVYSGALSGGLENLDVSGLSGVPHVLTNPPGQIALIIKSVRPSTTISWTGGYDGNAWDLFTTSNWLNGVTRERFAPGDNVRFDNTGTSNLMVALSGDLNPASVTVNSTADYTLSGSGRIIGPASLTKSNTGTLVITALNNAYTGMTVIAGGTVVVPELDAEGYPSPLGMADANPANFVISGNSTLRVTGECYTDRGLTLGPGTNTIEVYNSDDQATMAGLLTGGGSLQKAGDGTLALTRSNNYSGVTIIKAGTVSLGGDEANRYGFGMSGSGTVVLEGGAINMFDNFESYNSVYWTLNVPSGSAGTLRADGRVDYYGALAGGGTLTFRVPYVRTTLFGNWSGFTGRINVTTDSDGGDFRINNSYGYGNANVDVADKVSAYHTTSGASVNIGALSGAAGAKLSGAAWVVGAKGADTSFFGTIAGSSITKVGTGTWSLTGSNYYAGQTIVSNGTLAINGDNGSATGAVTVNSPGILAGTGLLGGVLTINGTVSPGNNGIGKLTCQKNVTFSGGGKAFIEVNRAAGTSDLLECGSTLTYGGVLQVTNLSGPLAAGDSFKIFNASAYAGSFEEYALPELGNDLTWDVSQLENSGTISVLSSSGVSPRALVWKGDGVGNAWDIGLTANWLDETNAPCFFANFCAVTFDDKGSNDVPIALSGVLQTASVAVNATKNYAFSGAGSLAGTNALIKSGTGQLTIYTSNTFTGGTTLGDGTLYLASANANFSGLGRGKVTLEGGTLEFVGYTGSSSPDYGGNTNALTVPAGASASIRLPQRFLTPGLAGPVSGSGELNLFVNYVRGDISGNWSNFFGLLNVRNTGSDTDDFRIVNTNGLPNAKLYVGSNVLMYSRVAAGSEIPVGEFAAHASSRISAGGGSNLGAQSAVTWRAGRLNTDATNDAVIQGTTALIKEGSGKWTLGGDNSYSGATDVNAGALVVNGNQAAATGALTVASAAMLAGKGTIGGRTTILPGATLSPGNLRGTDTIATLTFSNSLLCSAGSTNLLEVARSPLRNDSVNVGGTLTVAGTLVVTNIGAEPLAAGDTFTLFRAGSFSGSFEDLVLPTLPAALAWNTNALTSTGVISVFALLPPEISGIQTAGDNLVISGSGGPPGGTYLVLCSTNLAPPWVPVATNYFDASGAFSITLTNVYGSNPPQAFFKVQLQ